MSCLRSFFLAGATALVLAACSGGGQAVTLSDAFDLDVFGPHVEDLHTPYVAGAAFEITVSGGVGDEAQEGWTLSSSDPSVMRVTSALASGTVSVEAGGPGQATLSVLDASGAVRDTHIVTVAIPDQVRLYAQGLLLTGQRTRPRR